MIESSCTDRGAIPSRAEAALPRARTTAAAMPTINVRRFMMVSSSGAFALKHTIALAQECSSPVRRPEASRSEALVSESERLAPGRREQVVSEAERLWTGTLARGRARRSGAADVRLRWLDGFNRLGHGNGLGRHCKRL